ncbi:hypothetical protein [Granulicoccus phenolivorans]|uniref:hypothetical protein n=1 Tax=Granulicoccus phenolivorans TaxID=266854 RepID=UPI00040E6178|nr:hypothetical protein [Granulicoccus phenolivorans]
MTEEAPRGRGTKRLPLRDPHPPTEPTEQTEPTGPAGPDPAGRNNQNDRTDDPDRAGSRRTHRERLRDRAREFFGPRTWARMADRQRRAAADRVRVEADDTGDLSDREHLLRLRARTRQAGESYMTSLRDAHILVPGFTDPAGTTAPGADPLEQTDALRRAHATLMLQHMLRPLSRGVDRDAIVRTVGMMLTMRLLSPDFRQETDRYARALRGTVEARIEAQTYRRGRRAQDRADAFNGRVDAGTAARVAREPGLAGDPEFRARREARKRGRDDFLADRWRTRLAQLEHRDRGHRELFTTDTAAMTEVALLENAFWAMRRDRDHSTEIATSYRALRTRIHAQMADDGLDRREVVTRARTILGARMEAEPELRLMVNGMAHGRIVKAPPHATRVAGSDRVRTVWTGEFTDQLGTPIPADAMVTLRAPMDPAEHRIQLAATMEQSLLDGLRRDDPASYQGSLLGYLVGFAAQRQGLDTAGLPPVLQDRLEQTETMLAAMAIDGLTAEQAQAAYASAFTDAMEQVGAKVPGVEDALKRGLGEDWQATLQAAVDDPAGFLDAQRDYRAPGQAWRSGPSTGHRAEAGFDWGFAAGRAGSQDRQAP